MLLKVAESDPGMQILLILWLHVMYHQGRVSGSLSMKVTSTYVMNRTSTEFVLMDYLGCVFQLRKQPRSSRDATHHRMEDIMGHSALIQKSSKVDSIGQPCMTILETSYGGVLLVRNTGVPM